MPPAVTPRLLVRVSRADGCLLPFKELTGTTPTEEIDLSNKGLNPYSASIIAGCMKGNVSLKKLGCTAPPRTHWPSPHERFACRVRSVDGHPLPIDELKGTKPTEKIDLSNKNLGVASAIIIASCIKGNESLKELRYGAHLPTIPQHSRSAPLNMHLACS